MSDHESLKQIVSQLYDTPAASIGADFSLRHPRFQGSAGRGLLVAAIRRRLGVYPSTAFAATTYGELEAAILGGRPNGASATPQNTALRPEPPVAAQNVLAHDVGGEAAMSIGIDVEMVDSLPEVADFWTSDFYRTHFTGPEIAYCMQQEQPRMHFAARWCAKEALAKCDERFMSVDPSTVQVSVAEAGRPVFERVHEQRVERLPHALSLTHTSLLAAAVVALPKSRSRS